MNKKTVAIFVLIGLIIVFIISIGATFSAYKVAKDKVEVSSIKIISADGIRITDKDGVVISDLEVKSSEVGVRPATGEEDSATSIPTTVNDGVGTEGAYACFKLSSDSNWEIRLVSVDLSCGEEENLENVRVAIMEEENKPVSGKDVGFVLAKGEVVNEKEIVVVVWLDKDTTKSIKGAQISVEIEVIRK